MKRKEVEKEDVEEYVSPVPAPEKKRFVSLAVVGSRGIMNVALVYELLDNFISWLKEHDKTWIGQMISGGAMGVDTFARTYASMREFPFKEYRPSMTIPSPQRYLERNKQIAHAADVLLALWDGKSTGTLNTVKHAADAGKQSIYLFDVSMLRGKSLPATFDWTAHLKTAEKK